MKKLFLLALATALSLPAAAQPAPPTAGCLRYEATRRLDLDKVKITSITRNGQEITPDQLNGPDGPIELPTAVSFGKNLLYNGAYAREEREQRGLPVTRGGTGTGPAGALSGSVLVSSTDVQYLNLADRTATTVTTVANTEYQAPAQPVPAPPTSWQDLPQTKKIAGYLCHKVTATFKQEAYTLWVTTELPFTYSPVRELTPAAGVVLALSSDAQEYLATRLTAEDVPLTSVRPSAQARPVSGTELQALQARAAADMRQQLLERLANPAAR